MDSIYRRPLPPALVAFASPAGRALFNAAQAGGGMESFFPLIEQFHTQADPAFCGLGTLVVVLNALGVDPGRLWKGPWRWFSEELLDCCTPLDRVRMYGITLDELACLARCNGARAEVHRDRGEADFRAAVLVATRSSLDPALVVAYDRSTVGQTGAGHFSPVGGYDPASDHVLVLDVARFKYPPHWIPLPILHAAMGTVDRTTGRSRGWAALRRSDRPASLLFTAHCTAGAGLAGFATSLAELRARLADAPPSNLPAALRTIFTAAATLPVLLERRALALAEHAAAAADLLAGLRATRIHVAVAPHVAPPWDTDAATLLLFALPDDLWSVLPANVRADLVTLLDRGNLSLAIRQEVDHVHRQLADLAALTPAPCTACA